MAVLGGMDCVLRARLIKLKTMIIRVKDVVIAIILGSIARSVKMTTSFTGVDHSGFSSSGSAVVALSMTLRRSGIFGIVPEGAIAGLSSILNKSSSWARQVFAHTESKMRTKQIWTRVLFMFSLFAASGRFTGYGEVFCNISEEVYGIVGTADEDSALVTDLYEMQDFLRAERYIFDDGDIFTLRDR